MFRNALQTIKIILLLALITLLNACNDKKANEVVFEKEIPAKEDATKAYLHKVENYKKDKNYLAVLYKYYNQKIAARNYVNAAEVLDIAAQLGWGENKKAILKQLLAQLNIFYDVESLISSYVEISAYSQGKNTEKTLPKGASAKNMGKKG